MKVDASLAEVNLAAIAMTADSAITGWSSFSGKKYLIPYQRGSRIVEMNLPGYVPRKKIIDVSDERQGLRMLVRGRVHVFIVVENILQSILREEEFRNGPIRRIGVVERFWIYPCIHRKHSSLAVQLAKILRNMRADGTVENLFFAIDYSL
jgi:polar amino acid transport system substrate-binding protein